MVVHKCENSCRTGNGPPIEYLPLHALDVEQRPIEVVYMLKQRKISRKSSIGKVNHLEAIVENKAIKTYVDNPWYKRTSGVVTISAAMIGAVSGGVALWKNINTPSIAANNIAIVLDISAAFNSPMQGRSRGEATAEAIDLALQNVASSDNLALRTFGGGGCDSTGTVLVSNFSRNSHENIRSSIKKATYSGKRPLIRALLEATGDFNDENRFANKSKQLILITGGGDDCTETSLLPNFGADLIKSRLAEMKIKANVMVIGVGVAPGDRERLEEIAMAAGGSVAFADSIQELQIKTSQALQLARFKNKQEPNVFSWGIVTRPKNNAEAYDWQYIRFHATAMADAMNGSDLSIGLIVPWLSESVAIRMSGSVQAWVEEVMKKNNELGEMNKTEAVHFKVISSDANRILYEIRIRSNYSKAGDVVESMGLSTARRGPLLMEWYSYCPSEKNPDKLVLFSSLNATCFQSRW